MSFILFLIAALAHSSFGESELPLVDCVTTKGSIIIEVHREWAPLGADRFLELVRDDFYTDIALFRCVKRFLTQFGISDNPYKKHWHNANIPDDPNIGIPVKKHYVSYAGGGPNTRSTQLFIAFEDLPFLGKEPWETPFGVVVKGFEVLDNLYKEYGDIPPFGEGPDQIEIHRQGNIYVREQFPNIDFINTCVMVKEIEPKMAIPNENTPDIKNQGEEDDVLEDVDSLKENIGGELLEDQPNPAQANLDGDHVEIHPVNGDGSTNFVDTSEEEQAAAEKENEILVLNAVLVLVSLLLVLFLYIRYNSSKNGGVLESGKTQ